MALTIVGLLVSLSCFNIGYLAGRSVVRQEAVKNGSAKWVVDSDGVVRLTWNVNLGHTAVEDGK